MDLIFFLAVGLSIAALTPLALRLMGMAKDAFRLRSVDADGGVAVAYGTCSQQEVELSVRGRLYGERHSGRRAPRAGPPAAVRRGRLTQDRYRLLERVGADGMGGRLVHSNILAILDAGNEPRAFIVMELVDGTRRPQTAVEARAPDARPDRPRRRPGL